MSRKKPRLPGEVSLGSYDECGKITNATSRELDQSYQVLEDEVRLLRHRTKTGYGVELKWLPGLVRFLNGKKLAEEVRGNTIIIYAENLQEAVKLVHHGFMEWILNRQTKP